MDNSASETLNKPKKKQGRGQKKKNNPETLNNKSISASKNSRKVVVQQKDNPDNDGVDKLQIHGQSFHLFGDCRDDDDLGDLVEVVMTNDDVANILLDKSDLKKYVAKTKAKKGKVKILIW